MRLPTSRRVTDGRITSTNASVNVAGGAIFSSFPCCTSYVLHLPCMPFPAPTMPSSVAPVLLILAVNKNMLGRLSSACLATTRPPTPLPPRQHRHLALPLDATLCRHLPLFLRRCLATNLLLLIPYGTSPIVSSLIPTVSPLSSTPAPTVSSSMTPGF